MPDIDFQKIELNLIPKKGDEPVIFYASQYETARPFIADLFWGDSEFAPGDDCWAEIDIRKNDDNLVVITDDVAIDNNEVSVVLPIQAVTCIGKNLGQVKIYAADDQLIAALNFILEVQPDPLAGGVDSETAIDNLTQQIEDIATEVIGEDYYNKTEVDTLLADKADVSDLPDMTNYYTKTQTDTLLNGKADASTTYTKTEVDNALALKANSSDLATVATTGDYNDLINKPTIPAAQIQSDYAQADNTQVDYIKNKPDINAMIAAAIFDILPVATEGPSAICTFDTEIAAPLQSVVADVVATQAPGTPTPSNPLPISGHTEANITANGSTVTIAFGQTVYGGVLDVTRGKVHVTYNKTILDENVAISLGGYGMTFKCNILTAAKASVQSELSGTLSNKLSEVKQTDPWGSDYTFSRNQITPPEIYFNLNSSITTIEACKTFLESNPIDFVYELATPFDIDLTPEQISAIVGTNNVSSDTGDTTVNYKDTIQHYIDNQ